jgi:hypothetical protein
MDVNVGNFSDEDDMPGMAHAVEHVRYVMTWLGVFGFSLVDPENAASIHGHGKALS